MQCSTGNGSEMAYGKGFKHRRIPSHPRESILEHSLENVWIPVLCQPSHKQSAILITGEGVYKTTLFELKPAPALYSSIGLLTRSIANKAIATAPPLSVLTPCDAYLEQYVFHHLFKRPEQENRFVTSPKLIRAGSILA